MKQMPAIIAAGHPVTTGAAQTMLLSGGNAFDAAVAAGFAAAVAEPALTSLGGGGFLLARWHNRDGIAQNKLFDFFVDTPGKDLDLTALLPHFYPVTVNFSGSDQIFHVGLGAVAVPGVLQGLLHIHTKLGQLPLPKILAPAIRIAHSGIPLNAQQAHFLRLLHPIMTFSPVGQSIYQPEGRMLNEGDSLNNPLLAAFLEKLPDDLGYSFYHSVIAKGIASDMMKGQGLLTGGDLAGYRVAEHPPLEAEYRGHKILTNPPPSSGGRLIARSLQILQRKTLGEWGSVDHLTALAETMIQVEQQRNDTPFFNRGTTHVSIVDHQGNVATMTTSNGEGSGYFAPDTGIMLNNMMGEDDLHPDGFHSSPPGIRVSSMMSPTIVLSGEKVRLVLGSGGSKRIRTAIFQVLSHVVDFKIDLRQAVDAPRLHWDGTRLHIEPGWPEKSVAALEKRWPLSRWRKKDVYFGGVHAVIPGKSGAGDARRGGSVAVVST